MKSFDAVKQTAELDNCTIFENEPMNRHTTFKIGGEARLFIKVSSIDALKNIIKRCHDEKINFFVIGNGSNTLFSDDGYDGVILSLCGDFTKLEKSGDTEIICGSGALLSSLCAFARDNSLSCAEALWGVPASVGGAVFMNAGAYGTEMKDIIKEVYTVDLSGKEKVFMAQECDFSYRHSVFMGGNYIITGARFELKKGNKDEISKLMSEYMGRRCDKQPLEYPSAGSVFKRPEGFFAGSLIEQCNLKGFTVGGAQVSEKHAGFIINKGGATCENVLDLISHIQKTVYEKFKVDLVCEVRPVGRKEK